MSTDEWRICRDPGRHEVSNQHYNRVSWVPPNSKVADTRISKGFGEVLDQPAQDIIQKYISHQAGEPEAKRARITANVLSSFTPALMFERCSGDWCPVATADTLDVLGLPKPFHQGRLANIDQAYAVFQETLLCYFKCGGFEQQGFFASLLFYFRCCVFEQQLFFASASCYFRCGVSQQQHRQQDKQQTAK